MDTWHACVIFFFFLYNVDCSVLDRKHKNPTCAFYDLDRFLPSPDIWGYWVKKMWWIRHSKKKKDALLWHFNVSTYLVAIFTFKFRTTSFFSNKMVLLLKNPKEKATVLLANNLLSQGVLVMTSKNKRCVLLKVHLPRLNIFWKISTYLKSDKNEFITEKTLVKNRNLYNCFPLHVTLSVPVMEQNNPPLRCSA